MLLHMGCPNQAKSRAYDPLRGLGAAEVKAFTLQPCNIRDQPREARRKREKEGGEEREREREEEEEEEEEGRGEGEGEEERE